MVDEDRINGSYVSVLSEIRDELSKISRILERLTDAVEDVAVSIEAIAEAIVEEEQ